jgi:hypothetical protein
MPVTGKRAYRNGNGKQSINELRKDRFWGKDGQPGWYDEIGRPQFGPEFLTSQEAIIDDPTRSTDERSLAYWKRYSWANARSYAADDETGKPKTMVDCAARLGVDISQVSRAFKRQQERKEIYANEHLAYCPVRDKKSEEETKRCCVPTQPFHEESTTYKPTFETYIQEVWKLENPSEAAEWSRAEQLAARRAELKAEEDAIRDRFRPSILNSFRKWRKAFQNEAQDTSAEGCVGTQPEQAAEVAEVHNENGHRYATDIRKHCFTEEQVPESVSQSVAVDETLTDRLTELHEAIPTKLCERLNETPSQELLLRVNENMRGAPAEKLTERIYLRWKFITSLGLLADLADDVGRAYLKTQKERKAAAVATATRAAPTQEYIEIPDDPERSTRHCVKCGGTITEYESGHVSWCKCETRKRL